MQFVITYTGDRAKPINDWTVEFYDNPKEAEEAVIDLIYSGFYVRLDEEA